MTHQWLKELKSVDGPVGHRSADSQTEDRPMERKEATIKRYARRKARWRQVNPQLATGQTFSFYGILTPVRVLFYF
jgi:hypothetical protein